MTIVIDGKQQASKILFHMKEFMAVKKIKPSLAVIQVGDLPASTKYIKIKREKAAEIGMDISVFNLSENTEQEKLESLIRSLNDDEKVNGILVQMPLPAHLDKNRIIMSVMPHKDVDGFHPENFGKLSLGVEDGFVSCTPLGCLNLINTLEKDISGMTAVVIGRSLIVGRPMSMLLLRENASVTMLHSWSRDIAEYTRRADIVISATGRAGLIKEGMVGEKCILIDVGISKNALGETVGDSDFSVLKNGKVRAITPPIGGVGPMTLCMLMYNTLKAFCQQNGLQVPDVLE